MLVTLKEILKHAKDNGYAVGAFNAIDTTTVRAVIAAAEQENTAVVMMFAEVHRDLIPLEMIAPIMIQAAKKATVPVCIHLDHGTDMDYIKQAIELGFTSIMYDGSHLPYEENIANTAKVVNLAHPLGISVEAELGQLPTREVSAEADSDTPQNPDELYTNPDQAKDFIDRTNADALAIAFGTAHGVYAKAPALDFTIIEQVAKVTDLPLVMHGGSGVSEEGFKTAIKSGITKINYFTYMSLAGANGIGEYIANANPSFYHDIPLVAINAMKEDIVKAMRVFKQR